MVISYKYNNQIFLKLKLKLGTNKHMEKNSIKLLYIYTIAILIVIIAVLSWFLFKDKYIMPINYSKVEGKIIAISNGSNIYESEVVNYIKSLKQTTKDINLKSLDEKIKKAIITEVALSKELLSKAEEDSVDKTPAILKRVEFFKNELIKKFYIDKIIDKKITEDMIKEHYSEIVSKLKGQIEIDTQHIITKTKKEANEIRKKLKENPLEFDKLAKKYSIDHSNSSQAGHIGYLKKGDSVKEFEDVLFSLKKNEISKPVKTSFGWHIIKANNIRPITILSYEESKENVKKDLKKNLIANFIKEFVEKIDLQLK